MLSTNYLGSNLKHIILHWFFWWVPLELIFLNSHHGPILKDPMFAKMESVISDLEATCSSIKIPEETTYQISMF
jgi:hypothetical protein